MPMPARTLNDFFAGFFYVQTEEGWEVDMRITVQNGWRKTGGRQSPSRGDNVKTAKITGDRDNGQGVTVRSETILERKEGSAFSWLEECTVEWSEAVISGN